MKHPFRWLIAAVMLALAVQPVLLPHPVWVQSVIGGAAAAQGYAFAAACGILLRWVPRRWVPRRWVPRSEFLRLGVPRARVRLAVTAVLGTSVIVAAALTAHAGQVDVSARTQMTGPTLLADALGVAGAALFGTVLIGVGFGVRTLFRLLVRGLRPVRGRLAALLLVPALVLTGSNAAAADGGTGIDGVADTADVESIGTVRSTIGVKGAEFLRTRPDAATIAAVTGRPARTPIRVYIGLGAAASPSRRAALAVAELERTGGFRRAAVLMNVPTGSGWANPTAGSALEYLYGGDLATVVVQYAAAPSWAAYLRGGEGVQASTRALTDAIRARLNRIPARQRPRLLVYGESLGAWGGLRAYDREDAAAAGRGLGIARRIDGALWAGIPGSLPGQPPSRTRTLMHPDDPVPVWSLPLMLHQSPAWPARWLPGVTFWQATGDVIAATTVPPGFGHRYGPELVDAWRPLISTAAVPGAAPPDRLNAVRLAIGR
jgi:uncharacterized membrane protein